jgi:23S rRNA (uracil1939-C5)-methyltransferase
MKEASLQDDRPCPHGADYRAWKEGFVLGALRQHRLDFAIDEFISMPPRSRRRITLAFRKQKNEVLLGFHAPRSHKIVPLQDCQVTKPELIAALPSLRELLQHVTPKKDEGRVTLLSSEMGIDIAIEDVKDLPAKARVTLAGVVANSNFARLSVNGEIIALLHDPILKAGRAIYTPPPGAFVQAVEEAEIAMADKICATLKKYKVKCAADLFAGCGAFALRMAELCKVHAVESNEAALDTLQNAANRTQGLKPVTIEKRDLFRRPLLPLELDTYDAVILDPPRQGAQAQTAELCKSKMKLIIYVSCHPGTFARDAKRLIEAGYALAELTLIDQFLWSEHIELIAIFTRPR